MPSRWVKTATGWVQLDAPAAGLALSNVPPPALLADDLLTATSQRAIQTMLSPGTAHTLSAFTVLYAATSAASGGLFVALNTQTFTNNIDTRTVLVFYLGASGSEVEWARVTVGNAINGTQFIIPGLIPAGSRVSVKVQGAVLSQSFQVTASLMPRYPASIGAPVGWGVDLATSKGVVLPVATVNTKAAWQQLVASTPARLCALAIFIQLNGVTSANASAMLLDVGVGAPGAEVVVWPDLCINLTTSEAVTWLGQQAVAVDVPAGSRLAVRYARANAANQLDVALVGAAWSG